MGERHKHKEGDKKMKEVVSEFRRINRIPLTNETNGHDFEIKVGNKSFPVHKSKLVASSSFFREFFAESLDPLNKDFQNSLTFNLPVAGVECCVEFIYSGTLSILNEQSSGNLTISALEEVIKSARHMRLDELSESCFKYLKRYKTIENCLQAIEMCRKYSETRVVVYLHQFVKENFDKVVQVKNFPSITKEDLSEYLSMPNLDAELYWKALTTWNSQDKMQKKQFFSEKVEQFLVKNENISLELLVYDIWPNFYVQNVVSTKKKVLSLLTDKMPDFNEDPDVKICFRILEIANSESFLSHERQNSITDYMAEQFGKVMSLTDEFCQLQFSDMLAVLSSKYIICDERSKWEAIRMWLSSKFDAGDLKYESSLCKLLETIDFCKLDPSYISKMRRDGYVQESAKCLNLLAMKTESLRILMVDDESGVRIIDIKEHGKDRMLVPFKEKSHRMTSVCGQPYILRGNTIFKLCNSKLDEVTTLTFHSEDDWIQFIEFQKSIWIIDKRFTLCYTPATKEFKSWPSSCDLDRGFSAASSADQIYAVGGSGTHDHATKFDPKRQRWDELPPMPIKVTDTSSAYFKNKLYVTGGSHHGKRRSSVMCFADGAWSTISKMNEGRHKHGTVVFENRLYVVGGVKKIEVYDEDSKKWKIVGEVDHLEGRTSICVGNIPSISE